VCGDRTAIPEKHVLKIYFINDVLTLWVHSDNLVLVDVSTLIN